MNFHEYQAKELFAEYGIPVPAGRIARTPDEAAEAKSGSTKSGSRADKKKAGKQVGC